MDGAALAGETPAAHDEAEAAVVRFAGDSGDGMQLTGGQFTMATALAGNDLATFPDFPAEIRAPAGTTFGVSAFQINFGGRKIRTVGDEVDVLVAMNPAALKVNLGDVKSGGLIIADTGSFTGKNLAKAGYDANPLEDGSLADFKLLPVDMSALTMEATKPFGLGKKDGLRTKNMWALGLIYWMYGRDRAASTQWLKDKFSKAPDIANANIAAMNAGHAFGETAEMPAEVRPVHVPPAPIAPGTYRTVTGTQAMAWGLAHGASLAGLRMLFCSYPITPASQLLHTLSDLKGLNIETFQAEDEIAAVCAAIGGSYAGAIGVTSSSGPGIALKTEAIGLAIATELPLIIINSQRGGPSTGLPTKTEQSDLFQSVWGRNADAPLCVLSTSTPVDCFDVAVEAVRIATRFMTPVIVLSDGFLANASEPWSMPDLDAYAPFPVSFTTDPEGFLPYGRDPETLARPWARPGTPGLEHRIGGLEKEDGSGNISYDADNHHKMTMLRADKIQRIADFVSEQTIEQGGDGDRLAVVGWGSTYGPISRAVLSARQKGLPVSHIHLRHIWPLPRNLGALLRGYEQILVPEMNAGQLVKLLRAEYLVPAEGVNKVTGRPFKISELEAAIAERLGSGA